MVIDMMLNVGFDGGKKKQNEQSNSNSNNVEYFWKNESSNDDTTNNNQSSSSSSTRRLLVVPIQAWTALLKAYVHSGEMSKADSLFEYLIQMSSSATSASPSPAAAANKNKKNGPNVRTFNTLLRGCMWTAASIITHHHHHRENNDVALVGGVPTAQRAWSLCVKSNHHLIQFDTSSYEYFVTILSQSLQCKDALQYLEQMKCHFGIVSSSGIGSGSKDDNNNSVVDPSIMESIIVCLVSISRGFVMLGEFDQGQMCANEALVVMERLQLSLHSSGSGGGGDNASVAAAASSKKVVTGGKRAWNDGKKGGSGGGDDDDAADGNNSNNDGNGRREESNKLFRSHRLSELRSEALTLKNACDHTNRPEENIVTHDAKIFARLMMTRLFYFSGGGTTQTATVAAAAAGENNNDTKVVIKKDDNNSLTYQRWIHSLWHSFGLRETTQRAVDKDDDLQDIIFPVKKKKKKSGKQLPDDDLLSPEFCDNLRRQLVGVNCNVVSDDGCLNFDTIFQSEGKEGEKEAPLLPPLHVELGSGSGDWCVTQSKLNPNENYVTVELRADRVAQTFFKCITQNTWKNMCCVGSDCGSFLRDRVKRSQCRTIFVNHPEPPTQTYDSESSEEEPAHMLNSANLRLAANCLEEGGKGRLIVVTDNLIYARFLCRTMTRVMADDGSLVGLHPSQVRDLRTVDSFHVGNSSSKLWLYEGKASSSIGHFDAKQMDKGTSYFDRLWRTGAGKHADAKKRYIVAVCTSGGVVTNNGNFSGAAAAAQSFNNKAGKNDHGRKRSDNGSSGKQKEKKPKKRSAEAQKRRNERRLLKKEQAQKE